MLRIPPILFLIALVLLLSGCSSERDVNVEVVLKTNDASIVIGGVEFSAANSAMGMSKTSALNSEGPIEHDHVIDSSEGNFVIVELLRNGESFRSEIYKLDPKLLSAIGNQSDWVRPDGFASNEKYLNYRLMKQPESFVPADENIEFHTQMRYDVAKPYSY